MCCQLVPVRELPTGLSPLQLKSPIASIAEVSRNKILFFIFVRYSFEWLVKYYRLTLVLYGVRLGSE